MATIQPDMVEKLNAQIAREFGACFDYLAMAVHLDDESLEHLARFYYSQSAEEREHAMRIVDYLLEVGQRPVIPSLPEPKARYESPREIVQASLRQEQEVTRAIHELVDAAGDAKDHATFQFLQWFVEEQVEEEATMGKLVDLVEASDNILQVEHYVRHMLQE